MIVVFSDINPPKKCHETIFGDNTIHDDQN